METIVNTFYLKYANPVEVANELATIFPSSSGAQSPISVFGGRGGGRGGGGRGGGGANPFAALFGGGGGGDTTDDRIRRAQQVNAVPDPRIQAVVVTAPKSLMDQITELIDGLDVPSATRPGCLCLLGDQCRSEPGRLRSCKACSRHHGIAEQQPAKQPVADASATAPRLQRPRYPPVPDLTRALAHGREATKT